MPAHWSLPLITLNGPKPIVTPDGKVLRTMADAAAYAASLPRAFTDTDHLWQRAAAELMRAADKGVPGNLSARQVVYEAIFRDKPPPAPRLSKQEQLKDKRKKARRR